MLRGMKLFLKSKGYLFYVGWELVTAMKLWRYSLNVMDIWIMSD